MSMDFDYWASKAREELPEVDQTPAVTEENVTAVTESEAVNPTGEAVNPVSNEVISSNDIAMPIGDENISAAGTGILPEEDDVMPERPGNKKKRICKAVFLGVPFGIPLFLLMIICLSALVCVVCVLFGSLVIISACLILTALALVLLGISEVHIMLAPSILLIGSGILGTGVGILLSLLSRLVFKYVILGLINCYVYPVRFLKLFFVKGRTYEKVY
ncbi:MAG: hypothetical protein K6F93_03565 [Lachnospiraceae bacterium]|nr:hypothetical protein [Lachnospiraceae bacterium]